MQFKKFFAVLPALALSTALVAAQEPQPQPTTNQNQTQTDVGQPTDTNEPVFKGCVSGTKDNYTLTSSDGKSYRLHSDKDIAEHVGKMVEIRGTVKKEGADRPADAQPASAMSEIDVADVKNVEGSCPTTGASSDVPKSDATDQQASAATSEPAKTEEQPVSETPASTDTTSQPATSTETAKTPEASASASASTSTEPSASAAVSTQDQSASASTSTDANTNQATDQNATASAGNEQSTENSAAELPQTASPLPLLGLLGFASAGLGLFMRRK
jgi:LPXTG-motif cell wall-anchored protein